MGKSFIYIFCVSIVLTCFVSCGDDSSDNSAEQPLGVGIENTDGVDTFKSKAEIFSTWLNRSSNLNLQSQNLYTYGDIDVDDEEFDCSEDLFMDPTGPSLMLRDSSSDGLALRDNMSCDSALKTIRSQFGTVLNNLARQVKQLQTIKSGTLCEANVRTIVDPKSAYAISVSASEEGNTLALSLRGGSNEDAVGLKSQLKIHLNASALSDGETKYSAKQPFIDFNAETHSLGYIDEGKLEIENRLDSGVSADFDGEWMDANIHMQSSVEIKGLNADEKLQMSEKSSGKIYARIAGEEKDVQFENNLRIEELTNSTGYSIEGEISAGEQDHKFSLVVRPDPDYYGYCSIELN